MSSKVSIINQALIELGDDTILSLDDDSARALIAREVYDDCVDEVLTVYPWNFAIERQSLGRLDETPEYGYDYTFQLPTNPYCLRVLEIEDENSYGNNEWVSADYKIEGRKLLYNEETVKIKYIKRVEDTTEFSPLFKSALKYYIAYKLAFYITTSNKIREDMYRLYTMTIREAKNKDAKEGTPNQRKVSTWITVR